ncbi:unnamed protein product [Rangifer tarandus platyrhynchus]|uniref:Uncharacterized protein n=1 Tax=Rangifer tarandus platyrhynchus TaxID=3082113 RepID=A0AC59ZN02_RANTA
MSKDFPQKPPLFKESEPPPLIIIYCQFCEQPYVSVVPPNFQFSNQLPKKLQLSIWELSITVIERKKSHLLGVKSVCLKQLTKYEVKCTSGYVQKCKSSS